MMSTSTPFLYHISNQTFSLTDKSRHWISPLPQNRHPGSYNEKEKIVNPVCYGDYFSAITSYLSQNNFSPLRIAARHLYPYDFEKTKPDQVRIFLMKHGEYYHPARIEAVFGNKNLVFVLNVAVSAAGLSIINNEYGLLKHLQTSFPYSFIPRVSDFGEVITKQGNRIRMFIGEWFNGFYEFHLSRQREDNKTGIIVWNDGGNPFFLDEKQTVELFEQAAQILTAYYNPFSFEHISSWHHAAGDFVVKIENQHPTVRLITVRNYSPMIKNADNDLEAILDGLLIFLLNLSIRIRIDRIDGVGEFAWADEPALKGAVQGFFNGLSRQADSKIIPIELIYGFKSYLLSFNPENLMDWAFAVVGRIHPKTPELDLIRLNLPDHINCLHDLISDFLGSG